MKNKKKIYMTEHDRLKLEHAALQGQFIGFLEGLSWWKLPEELVVKIKEKRKELIEKYGD